MIQVMCPYCWALATPQTLLTIRSIWEVSHPITKCKSHILAFLGCKIGICGANTIRDQSEIVSLCLHNHIDLSIVLSIHPNT